MDTSATLYTAQELEERLGRKYFYRQSIYRMAEDRKISSYRVGTVTYFSTQEVVLAVLERLAQRIRNRYHWLNTANLRIRYDETKEKVITIYGFRNDAKITVDTQTEAEEDLLNKIGKGVTHMPEDIPVGPPHQPPPPPHGHGPHRHGPPPPPHHVEMMEALRRIEDRLARIEEKVG
jgi:hypothetical protein